MHPLKKEMNCRLLLVFVTIIVSAIVYFINTGFELNDEGFYFNGYDRAQPIFFSLTGFHYLVRLLPFSSSVIINRIYRLLLHGLSAFILAKALSRYFKLNIPFVELFLWMLLGNLYSYVYAPPSLSYNVINLFLLQMSLAAYLYFISEGQRYNKYYLLLIILISLLFFNKLTTGILLCLLLSLDFFFREGEHKFLKIVKLISFYFSIGIGVFLCFYLVNGQHLFDAVQMIIKKEGPFNIKHTNEFYQAKQLLWNPFYQSKKQIIYFLILYFLNL